MGKKYVIKHIKTKHQDKLAVERERVSAPAHGQNCGQLAGR